MSLFVLMVSAMGGGEEGEGGGVGGKGGGRGGGGGEI